MLCLLQGCEYTQSERASYLSSENIQHACAQILSDKSWIWKVGEGFSYLFGSSLLFIIFWCLFGDTALLGQFCPTKMGLLAPIFWAKSIQL